MTGGDRDAHGCIGSAGYTWSALRNDCVRLFEVGLRLDAPAPTEGSAAMASAFLVFATDDSTLGANERGELFLPSGGGPLVLLRAKGEATFSKPGEPHGVSFEGRWAITKDGATLFVAAE